MRVRHAGQAPCFLSPWVASYICFGMNKLDIPKRIDGSPDGMAVYEKVCL